MSRLVIAEKPSVAQSIASVLGAVNRKDGYLEGGGYLVSWCFGHLAELSDASAYNPDYAKWRYEDLPILPEKKNFQRMPIWIWAMSWIWTRRIRHDAIFHR